MKTIKKMKLISHKEYLQKMFKKPGFKKAYDALEPEFKIIDILIEARINKKISQREFSKRVGIAQSALARFESGKVNPTLSFLEKITRGLELTLTVKPARG